MKAIIFDAFGTLLTPPYSPEGNPFKKLEEIYSKYLIPLVGESEVKKYIGREWFLHKPFSAKLTFGEIEKAFKLNISAADKINISTLLKEISQSIKTSVPYPDALETWKYFRKKGIFIGIASNLSYEYGATVKRYFKNANKYFFSFDMNTSKPQDPFYKKIYMEFPPLDFRPVFVGDRIDNDHLAPLAHGFSPYLIDREHKHITRNAVKISKLSDLIHFDRMGTLFGPY